MGVWGSGLYSSDMALDLKAAVAAVIRLPLDANELVTALRSTQPDAADDPQDEEHTTFWLVLADQLEKRGIACSQVRDKALAIIDGRLDLRCQADLGLSAAGLRQREKFLTDLRERILAASQAFAPRKVLKAPQPFILEVGGVYAYPTRQGVPINPYMGPKYFDRATWQPDGFGAFVILARGRALGYLAWYQALVIGAELAEKPDISSLADVPTWVLANPGTMSPAHCKRIEIEQIGTIELHNAKVAALPGIGRLAVTCAISDISFCDFLMISKRSTPPEKLMQIWAARTTIAGLDRLAP